MIRDEALEWIVAREQIRDVLLRYCRGVDRCDLELLRSVYHPDAVDDHGSFKGNGWEFAEMIVASKLSGALFSIHHVGNMLIEVDAESGTASAETYFVAASRLKAAPDDLQLFVGRYVDVLARRDGEWRIAQRTVVHDFSGDVPVADATIALDLDVFAHGARFPDDPVYR
ncbi:MAG: nuclear transport factor 2 family protein [Acidimicrobiales bacterium]